MNDLFNELCKLKSLLVGLSVTGKAFTKPGITVHFPRRTVDNVSTWRSHIELTPSVRNDRATPCIACGTCARACPSDCIVVQGQSDFAEPDEKCPATAVHLDRLIPAGRKTPVDKKPVYQYPTRFTLDFTTCSLCGTCVESCPVDALSFSDNAYLAGFSADDFRMDLLDRLRRRATKPAEGRSAA